MLLCGTREPVVPMVREKPKWRTHEGESADEEHGGGPTRSSVEISVMEMERRGWIIWPYLLINQEWEEPKGKATLSEPAAG